jgi:hypothetical protein
MASPGPDTLIRATSKRQMGRAPSAGAEDARQRRTGGRGREMQLLHGELVAIQERVKASVFEGRDTAGKGGTIKRITERVSLQVFRVVALPAPTKREKSQIYIQRYLPHFPAADEVVIFDRSFQGVPAGQGRPGRIFVHPTDWHQAYDVTIKLDWRPGQPDSRLSRDVEAEPWWQADH